MPTTDNTELLDAVEVANLLRTSRWQVYSYVREGVLPAVRLGRSIRFSKRALEDWIAAGGRGARRQVEALNALTAAVASVACKGLR